MQQPCAPIHCGATALLYFYRDKCCNGGMTYSASRVGDASGLRVAGCCCGRTGRPRPRFDLSRLAAAHRSSCTPPLSARGCRKRCEDGTGLAFRSIANVRFSNRPVGVKRFQALQYSDGNVARGLVLLYGLGTSARPSWDSKTRWNDLLGGLAVGRSKRTCELTSSIVPRGT